jgi:hypothetical protein
MLKKIYNLYTQNFGLIDDIDSRDFNLEVLAGKVTKKDLTNAEFQVADFKEIINQGSTDFCVGCGKAYAKEITEGMLMSWAGAFANGCRAQGYVSSWGISILSVMKGAVKYGVPERRLWDYENWTPRKKESGRNYFANWLNMDDEVENNAYEHRDGSFFRIKDPIGMDRFDTFRAYLNKMKNEKIVIQTGIDNHNITLIGQQIFKGELCLKAIDSLGEMFINYRTGSFLNGYRYFNRYQANKLFNGYVSSDLKRTLVDLLNQYDGRAVKVKDDPKCYLIKEGKRHWLANESTAWSHGILLYPPHIYEIREEEMKIIPEGKVLNFKDGKDWKVIEAILRKVKRLDLLT